MERNEIGAKNYICNDHWDGIVLWRCLSMHHKFLHTQHLENRFRIENQFHQLDGTNLNSFRSHINWFEFLTAHKKIHIKNKWFGLLVIIFPKKIKENMHYLCTKVECIAREMRKKERVHNRFCYISHIMERTRNVQALLW